ncbi:hypothetical protein L208DRAFT_1272432 [Tricholoma matsutake]|nr:hypothetical protein L208DRAFT_1272432 [Tricholoma matsutake 945]
MGEITACICGLPVASEERIMTSMTAVVCGYRGCETAWFHLECLNLQYAPRGWRCEIHAKHPRH